MQSPIVSLAPTVRTVHLNGTKLGLICQLLFHVKTDFDESYAVALFILCLCMILTFRNWISIAFVSAWICVCLNTL